MGSENDMTSKPDSVVEATAPCRVDLAGGTLDIWPLGLLHRDAVTVNAAVPVAVRVRVGEGAPNGEARHRAPDGRLRRLTAADERRDLTAAIVFGIRPSGGVYIDALEQPPVGSGLGGSSSYGAALTLALHGLKGRVADPVRTVEWLRDVEATVLGTPTGTQDHWAAVQGGVLAIHHEPGGERLEPLAVDEAWLEGRLTVFFTGLTHSSGAVNWRIVRRRLNGEPDACRLFDDIVAAARACRAALIAGDEVAVGEAVSAEWAARRALAPEVSPAELDRLVEEARRAGATAVKGCGAAGGGSFVLWHEHGARDTILAAMHSVAPGGRLLSTGVHGMGWSLT